MTQASSYYSERLLFLDVAKQRMDRLSFYFFMLRILLFLALAATIVWLSQAGANGWIIGLAILLLVLFLFIIKANSSLSKKQKDIENRLLVNKNEEEYLRHSYSGFDDGERFKGLHPTLAGDFDIFGKGSLFQYLNRSVTPEGAERFAEKLCHWTTDKDSINQQQDTTKELSLLLNFMESFQSLVTEIPSNGSEVENLKEWFKGPKVINQREKILLIAYPIFFIIIASLVFTSIASAAIFTVPIVFALVILSIYKKKVDNAHSKLGKSAKLFEMYSNLMGLMENQPFQSIGLLDLQSKFVEDKNRASSSIKRLFLLLNRFDYRFNFLANILLNGSLLFEIQVLYQLEQWKEMHMNKAIGWFDALAEMDALIGFGRYAFNNQEATTYPTISEHPFCIMAKSMGHPLIPNELRVNNDLGFCEKPKVIVVTGANMAGKSTFLRTIAVNLILAHNGAPVCASEFIFTPCDIVSSINIHDSLSQNKSYFYAELLRIQQIIDQAAKEPNTLVILDEILRGTNPKDKQMGSIGLIEKLIGLNAFTVIATHDLAIGQMETSYPNIVVNHCFEVELDNDQLVFDYKLKGGISKKLNASFLMKKMGIID